MRNYFTLTRILLKTGVGNMAANMSGAKKRKKNGSTGMIILWVFVGICMLPYLGMIFGGVMGLYHMMAAIGQEGIVFDLILLAGSMVTLVFGVTYVLTFFYMTNDTETLLPLPLSPWQIIGAKFTVVFVYECFTNLLLVGPAIVGYGVAARWGVINWIMGILQFFFLPNMPLVYAGILSILLMKIFHRIANRNFISVLSTVLMLVIVFGMSALGSSMGSMDAEKMVELMTEGGNSLVGMMGGIFPLLSFGSKAAVFGSFLDLLIVLLGNAAAVAVFLFVGQKLYFSGVLGMNETSSKRRKISYKERQKLIKGNSPLTAYIGKEWKLLVRTPVYFLNCALFPLIWPVFFCVPVVISLFTNGAGEAAGEAASQITPAMIQLLMEQPMTAKVALLIVFGITVFIGSMGFVSGTAISREGTGFIFMKYIPVPYRTQLLAKLSVGMILTLISTTGYILIALIIMVILGFPPLAAVFALLISFFLNGIINLIDLGMDLISPKLNWENEQMAVKQNLNTMLEMLVCVVVCGVLGVVYGVMMIAFNWNLYVVSVIITVLAAGIAAGLYVLVMHYGERRLQDLE